MARIARKDFQVFINAGTSGSPAYEVLGTDLEEMNIALNKNVNTTNNILGQTSTRITNGNKQADVAPFFADDASGLFTKLQGYVDNDSELDDLLTDVVEVKLYESETSGAFPAFKQNVYVEVVSHGGNTDGYAIPFNLHFVGERIAGMFNPTTKTFTAN